MRIKDLVFVLVLFSLSLVLQECKLVGSSNLTRASRCRERREFMSMPIAERARFVRVLKRVSTDPSFSHRYIRLVSEHPKLFNIVHNTEQFFPWHRRYLLQMENLLRELDPSITLPYWDWSLVSAFPWRNGALDLWTTHPWGLGGNGDRGNLCVSSGPFAPSEWKRPRNASGSWCLKRNFTGIPPGIMVVHRALRFPPEHFDEFQYYVREFLHNALHVRVGGTMAEKEASLAPEFFLHHAFLDKIWSDYQKQSWRHKWNYFINTNHTIYNTTIKAKMMVDNNNLIGIRVCYKDPYGNYSNVHKRLRKYSVKMIQSFMNRNAFQYPFQNFISF